MIVEMGRPKTINLDLPPRMIRRKLKGKTLYYYVHRDGSRPPLGDDLNTAKIKWAEIENGQSKTTIKSIAELYRKEVIPTKAPKTQKEQNRQLDSLIEVFGNGCLEDLKPKDIRRYLKQRSAPIAANREMAVFSHMFNWARQEGHTDAPNPCLGVDRNPESPRKVRISNDSYDVVYSQAPPHIQDAMDLALLTGQRVSDVLKMKISDIKDGWLYVKQNKTGKELEIQICDDLEILVNRIFSRKRNATGIYLIQNENGQRVTYDSLRYHFVKARGDEAWQFRDIRAKTATDFNDEDGASKLLGHADKKITKTHYIRSIDRAKPLKKL